MSKHRSSPDRPSLPHNAAAQNHRLTIEEDTPVLFLSDAHLGAFSPSENRKIENEIIALLEFCQTNGYRLIILGDLFDYWMEYPGWHPPLGRQLLSAFRSFHQHYQSTLYITGNHDYWYLQFLEEVGFDMEREYRILQHQNKRVLLLHGDGLSNPEFQLPRSFFNRILRSPAFTRIYRKIFPPKFGLQIMKYISMVNKWLESEKSTSRNIRLPDWSRRLLENSMLDAVVCGHNHNPRLLSFNSRIYLNPGPFGTQKTLGMYTNHDFKLVEWDVSNRELVSNTVPINS